MFFVLCCLTAASAASPKFDPNWSRLPAGSEIPELRTATSRTFSNGGSTFTVEIHVTPTAVAGRGIPVRGHADSSSTSPAVGTGTVSKEYYNGSWHYTKSGPGMIYGNGGSASEAMAWAKFDLTAIPDSSLVYSVTVHWYQYLATGSSIAITVRLPFVDPATTPAEILFNTLHTAQPACSSQSCNGIGWQASQLDENGIWYVGGYLGQDWAAFGIHEGTPSQGGRAYGTEGDSLAPYLDITYVAPGETDIQAVAAALATFPMVAEGTPDTAEAVFQNMGLADADSFTVYAIASGGICDSATIALLRPGQTAAARLFVPTPATGDRQAQFRFVVSCSRDPWHANDTSKLACWVFPHGTYLAESFENDAFPPPGWSVIDNDSGNTRWRRVAEEDRSHSGRGLAFSAREASIANDDWLISGPVFPTSDGGDSVGFYRCRYQNGGAQLFSVWALHGQSVNDTVKSIHYSDVPETVYRRRVFSLDEFDGDTIYVGFRNVSHWDWNALCIDDVWFSRVSVPSTNDFATGIPTRPTLTVEPNPAFGRYATVRHSPTPGPQATMTLRDVLGRTVTTVALDPSGFTRLDLRGIAPGVYVATLESASPSVSRKLIITSP